MFSLLPPKVGEKRIEDGVGYVYLECIQIG